MTPTDIQKIAKAVAGLINPMPDDKYPYTAEQKAKQLGLSYSRFMKVYQTMDLKFIRRPGRRRIMFQ